jgi:hypothetical protein
MKYLAKARGGYSTKLNAKTERGAKKEATMLFELPYSQGMIIDIYLCDDDHKPYSQAKWSKTPRVRNKWFKSEFVQW